MLQIYDASDVGYVVWNDQVPGSKGIPPRTPHAHSKGEDGSGCSALLGPRMPAHMWCTLAVSCGEGACCILLNTGGQKIGQQGIGRNSGVACCMLLLRGSGQQPHAAVRDERLVAA